MSYETLHRALPRLGLFWTVQEWEAARDWLVQAQAEAGGTVSPAAAAADPAVEDEDEDGTADAAPGKCRRLLCCCCRNRHAAAGGDAGTANASALAGELLHQETLVRFLMTPPCELLTSEDPVSDVATASWQGVSPLCNAPLRVVYGLILTDCL